MNNILFVCSANKQRSKTGEDYFSVVYPKLNFKSAGTNIKTCEKEGTTPLTEDLLIWADVVLVMEEKHRQLIKQHTSGKYGNKIIVLSIEDIYKYYQSELIKLLIEKTENVFSKIAAENPVIEVFYINKIESNTDGFSIFLNSNWPPLSFDETDKTPINKIDILNPDFNGSPEELKSQMDFYEDGIIFEIIVNGHRKILKTMDLGGRICIIQGQDIKLNKISYTEEELWNIIIKYKKHLEEFKQRIAKLE
jgi:predicted protein tyrosine phosphatase